MNAFIVELPAELQAEVARRANQKPGGESAWVADAIREKLEACVQLEYLKARAARGSRETYDRVLSKVPAVAPLPGDERSPSRLTHIMAHLSRARTLMVPLFLEVFFRGTSQSC